VKNYEHNAPGGFRIAVVLRLLRVGIINITHFAHTLMWPRFGFFSYL
jgi:hypothetical protein